MNTVLPFPYAELHQQLQTFIPTHRLITDPLRTLAYGTDASFYRLIPKIIVRVDNEAEVIRCLHLCHRYHTPVTFRAAGTSLSGQAISDSVLLMLGHDSWKLCEISPDTSTIRLQPGVIGAIANRSLAPLGKKIGPDPASINVAQIGGIAANNASGMCCGTAQNSYNTLAHMRIVFADGSVLDTAHANSCQAFSQSHGDLLNKISELSKRVQSNSTLVERIRSKFKIKNTIGYSLNALIDFTNPIDVITHLMIGSEGTLGFISELTYHTVVEHPYKASTLVLFPDVQSACATVAILKAQPVSAVELMDRASLRSVENKDGMPTYLKGLPDHTSALLIETRAAEKSQLQQQVDSILQAIVEVKTLFPVCFTDVVAEYTQLWNIRKGLFPSIGSMRETGTTVVIEDVAFQVHCLAAATLDLQALFKKYAYHEAIIFGHALEGNLHFVFTQDFSKPTEVERYRGFMDEVCEMVVKKYDGSLKGEHGTGRNMAPFVEMEWGKEAYGLMQEIKAIFDPDGLLNPGVILNPDSQAHIKHLKPLFAADPLIDKCIECGFCEPNCPSHALTLTPRQRIVGLRELSHLAASQENPQREKVLRDLYQYYAIDTCAGDSLCAMACPVSIDTGSMMKALRGRSLGSVANKVADLVANHFGGVATAIRWSLRGANLAHGLIGSGIMQGLSSGVRKVSGGRIPLWNRYMPTTANIPTLISDTVTANKPCVVYFPSCASRTMGPARGDPHSEPLPVKTAALLHKAGFSVIYPEICEPLCCGMPFQSKGAMAQADVKTQETVKALRAASQNGQYPIVFDTSPCVFRLQHYGQVDGLTLLDMTEFLHDYVLKHLTFRKKSDTVAIHSTCSTIKMGLEAKLRKIAECCVERVIVPEGVTCCGWAGDKGFTQPELNASALRLLQAGLPEECHSGYSTSRTCEIGLSLHSGRYYRSIVYLVDECSAALNK